MESSSAWESLNPQQRAAVSQIEGPVLILAGPGSGKTRVITQRIANIIHHGVPSYQVAALTFTNKAAEEMKKRLELIEPRNQVWCGTFHRFCSRLLRQYASLTGLAENFSIFDSDDSKKVMKQAVADVGVDLNKLTPDRLANKISSIKNAGITPEQFEPRPGVYLEVIAQKVYQQYQQLLRLSNGVDFDDLLLLAVELLRSNPDLREGLDRKYAYMLVDEYQDTNTAQYQLIRLLNHTFRNLTATGDPDQSIYGWRGANINNILHFERDYPEVRVFRLEQNYRSTKAILSVADQLIANNLQRKSKTLFTDNPQGKQVRLISFKSPDEEAADIADLIALAIRRGDRNPRDYAILYRANYLSRVLEHAFRRKGIPFRILRGFEFYQRKEIKDLLGYLQLINNPSDGVALDRIINVPARSIGKVTVDRIRQFAVGHRISMFEAAERCQEISQLGGAARLKIKKFVELMQPLMQLHDQPVPDIIEAVLTSTGYREWLVDTSGPEDEDRVENVDELLNAAEEFERDHQGQGGLELYLEQASLVSDTDAMDAEADYVTMMTLHAAKGLEYPSVFIVGLEEGILPHERSSQDEAQVEEERRLLFVGITRAEQELQLSRCFNRFRRGGSWPCIPSRFLMELPRHELEIFEPSSLSSDQDWSTLTEGLDPFMLDGLPSYDINDDGDFPSAPLRNSAAGYPRSPGDPDRLAQSPSVYAEPDLNASHSSLPSPALQDRFPRLMTAADLEKKQASEDVGIFHPSCFQMGMQVEHDEYGQGVITHLQGEGTKKMATIDFPGLGKKRFKLAFSKLRPLNSD
jgi:DNA helicase-2/ATP-dependent DNA helicase PcrA